MSNVYNRIERLCENKGVSGYRMCADVGISRSFITGLRKGRTKSITPETAEKIANYFGVSIDYLVTGKSDNPEPTQKEKAPVLDDEALDMMEQMHKRPELKVLFSTSIKAKKEDIEAVDKLLKHMAGEGNDYDD